MNDEMHAFLNLARKTLESDVGASIVAFLTSSLAGLAELLRSEKELKPRVVIAALLHSGLWGVAIVALTYHKLSDDVWTLLGLCILSGIGGATVTDFAVSVIKRGLGIRLTVDTGSDRKG